MVSEQFQNLKNLAQNSYKNLILMNVSYFFTLYDILCTQMDEIRKVGDDQDIEMSFNAGRITLEGVREEVDKTKDTIHELLRKFQRERWLDEEAKLVADTVQWSFMVCDTPPPWKPFLCKFSRPNESFFL